MHLPRLRQVRSAFVLLAGLDAAGPGRFEQIVVVVDDERGRLRGVRVFAGAAALGRGAVGLGTTKVTARDRDRAGVVGQLVVGGVGAGPHAGEGQEDGDGGGHEGA